MSQLELLLQLSFALKTFAAQLTRSSDGGYFDGHKGCQPADGGDCEEVLAHFAKARIGVDTLAAQLHDEGAKSFVKSWTESAHGNQVQGSRLEIQSSESKGSKLDVDVLSR